MSESRIALFGDYAEPDEGNIIGRLSLRFQSGSLDIDELWEGSLLSASFLSTFWGKFFPVYEHEEAISREKMQDEVHYICSELLGNAVKFSHSSDYMIEICLYLHETELRIYVRNSVSPEHVQKFQNFIRKILTEDTQELFLEQMERSAEANNSESGVGYLTMMNDYHATLAWKFESITPDIISVTTLARMYVIRRHRQK